jgi:hypothetical protein
MKINLIFLKHKILHKLETFFFSSLKKEITLFYRISE